jgi:tRNA U34 5-carboxymethylaminomethyl modifying GTPase MnmE/TrmE
MFKQLSRGIKFGKKASKETKKFTKAELLFSQARPIIHLQNEEDPIDFGNQNSNETFFSSEMTLEGEFDSKNITNHIKELKYLKRKDPVFQENRREMLIAGESNVGKSSLINCLTM